MSSGSNVGSCEPEAGWSYPRKVTNVAREAEPGVEELRQMLERELERQARPWQGCWPLVIAALGVLLGLLLLLRLV